MSALVNYQSGQTYPAITTTMLAKVATNLNPTDTATFGGPPPVPHVIEAIIDALVAIDEQLNGG